MKGIELIVALLVASTVLAGVARAIHVHYTIVLVLGGLAVGLVSGTSAPQVDPHTVLFVFLPPLIYAASFSSSTQDLRTHARAIGVLAVGLVLVSMTAVAAVLTPSPSRRTRGTASVPGSRALRRWRCS